MRRRFGDIRVKSLLIFLLVVPLLKPEGVEYLFPALSLYAYDYGFYLSSFVIIAWFVFSTARRRSVSGFLVLFLGFVFYVFLVTLLNDGSLYDFAAHWSKAILAALLYECNRSSLKDILSPMLVYLELLLYANLLCTLLYPSGMFTSDSYGWSANWLLGYKSSLQYYVVPACAISLLYAEYLGSKIRFVVLLIACHIQTFISSNTMLLVGLAVFDLLLVFVVLKRRQFPVIGGAAVVGGLNALFVSFGTWAMNNVVISGFIQNVLGKEETVFTRFELWQRALALFADKPLFGYGEMSIEQRTLLFDHRAEHVHNQVVELLFRTGIVGFLYFLILLVFVGRKLLINRDLRSSHILSIVLFALLVMIVFEVFIRQPGSFVWLLFFMANDTHLLDEQLSEA